MKREEARKITDEAEAFSCYIYFDMEDKEVTLDGHFTLEDIRAIYVLLNGEDHEF